MVHMKVPTLLHTISLDKCWGHLSRRTISRDLAKKCCRWSGVSSSSTSTSEIAVWTDPRDLDNVYATRYSGVIPLVATSFERVNQ